MKKRPLGSESQRRGVTAEVSARYVSRLSRLINCKTVWTRDGQNAAEFERFYTLLTELFPLLTERAERLTFGGGCFFYIIRGKNATKNILLMSHHDVVDGGEGWETDPFTATERDGFLYGRGTIDTKTPLFAELTAVEELLAEGYEFDGINLYVGSSHNEEVCGDGMVLAAAYFKERGIRFDTVLDEGGAITEGQIPGVRCKSAVVAVHEKSRHVYRCRAELTAKGHGGFGGATDNAAERLCRFITEATAKRDSIFKGHFYPEVKATFSRHAPYMSPLLGLLFGHMTLFSPLIKKIMMGIPAAAAMLSTSLSFTTLKAGNEEDPQLRAKMAEATLFLRCVREEDLTAGLVKLRRMAARYGVVIEEVERDYCKPTDIDGEGFARVEAILQRNFPDVVVAPFLLTAGTDARRLTDVADHILRFAPIDLSRAQFATIHAPGEHIGIRNVGECVVFYRDFIQSYHS